MIKKNTLAFLSELAKNNNRDWFQENKSKYEEAKSNVIDFAEEVLIGLGKSDKIETPSGKKSLFRIYRDIRFSKDKTPYKTHLAGAFKRLGEDRRGGMGFFIKPGASQIVGGFFGPNKEDLLHLRKQIKSDPLPLRNILSTKDFRDYFKEIEGEQLKSAPLGFSKEDPNIDLLRYKQFIITHSFKDEEVLSKDFPKKVIEGFQKMRPFFDVMTDYLTTDLNGVSIISKHN